jgi:TonB dependent receptor-like, beta-barrel/TonB-dependent Receptor Plug Domain/Carboxypeptidase regulatory-like domain
MLSTSRMVLALELLLGLLTSSVGAQQGPVSFHFDNVGLRSALDTLIIRHGISLAYVDAHLEGRTISGQCEKCSVEQALSAILKETPFSWKRIGNQFILEYRKVRERSPHSIISGTITDSISGEVLINASLLLLDDSHSAPATPLRGATSNKFGFYSIPDISPGRYTVLARMLGYRSMSVPCAISDATSSLHLDLRMVEEDIRLQEVVVEGTTTTDRRLQVSSIEVAPEFIKQLPSLGGEIDVFRSLQLLPGVKASSEVSSGLYIRGSSPDQNLTLLDGVVLYNPSHLGGFLSTFNPDALNRIQLIKGAFPAEYGGRLSSIIDLTMREGTKEKVSGAAGLGMISSHLTLEGPLTENSSFMVSGRRMYLDLLYPLFADGPNIPRYYFYDLNAKVNYSLSASDRLFGSGYFGRDVFSVPPDNGSDELDMSWGNASTNLRWVHILSPSLFTNFSIIYTNYDFSSSVIQDGYFSREEFTTHSGIEDVVLRGELQFFPNELHTIKSGIELTGHNFAVSASDNVDIEDGLLNRTTLTALEAAVYLQDEWKVTQRLSTNLGGRFYYFHDGRYIGFEPRLAASYELSEGVLLKGSLAVAHQFLHLITRDDISVPTDLWFPSTETVLPSWSIQGVVGLETGLFDDHYSLAVEGYFKKMKNLYEYRDGADFSFGVPVESQFTSGTGVAYGLEFLLNKPAGPFTGWLGYTLAWTSRTFPDLNYGRSFPPRYDQRHSISAVLTYRLGDHWEFGATWEYGTGQASTLPTGQYIFARIDGRDMHDVRSGDLYFDYTERNAHRLPAFHKLDLSFVHKFRWFNLPFQFSINVYNAYNRANVFREILEVRPTAVPRAAKPVIRRITLFPIIPTLGLTVKF